MKKSLLVFWLLLVCAGIVPRAFSQQPSSTVPSRVISADYQAVKGPKSTVYRRCVGAGRVGEGLRADWQAQLKTCQEAIGFEYMRCHGLLHDEMGVYREDAAGNPIYNWQYIDMVYDFLLSIHVRPFVEIGFMPEALATVKIEAATPPLPATDALAPAPAPVRKVSVFWWKANVSPPKSYEKWDALITALVQHWTDRYGADEVKKWYFEIWNEPNHPSFFSPNDPSKRIEEYFELYAQTAKAVKAVNPAYRVGGPAGAGPVWVKDILAYCAAQQVPIDFISFHAYGSGPSGLDAEGHKRLFISHNLGEPWHVAHSQDKVIAQSPFPHLPVEITEWSASYSNHDPVHDTYFEAPYILEQLKHTETLGAMSYWTFSDIFEESGPPMTPFEGGFGLINLQGIKKAAFFAYQFLNELGDTELQNADPQSWVCRDDKGGVQALMFDLTDPRHADRRPDKEYFRQVIVPQEKAPVTLSLTSLPPGSYHLTTYRIGYKENDAYTAYLKLGAPTQLSPVQVQQLKDLAAGKPVEDRDVTVSASGTWEEQFPMRENEVVFAKLTPVSSAVTGHP